MKILPLEELEQAMERRTTTRLVHCHGCFDLLHVGHVRHLQAARSLGDCLVVTVTADAHIKKGPGRPVFNEDLRAEVLAALACVDYVAVVHAADAVVAIRWLRPTFYVKGPDVRDHPTPALLREADAVASVGGKLVFTDTLEYHSTALLAR